MRETRPHSTHCRRFVNKASARDPRPDSAGSGERTIRPLGPLSLSGRPSASAQSANSRDVSPCSDTGDPSGVGRVAGVAIFERSLRLVSRMSGHLSHSSIDPQDKHLGCLLNRTVEHLGDQACRLAEI